MSQSGNQSSPPGNVLVPTWPIDDPFWLAFHRRWKGRVLSRIRVVLLFGPDEVQSHADDVAQETWTKVVATVASTRWFQSGLWEKRSVLAWLKVVARSVALNYIRRYRAESRRLLGLPADNDGEDDDPSAVDIKVTNLLKAARRRGLRQELAAVAETAIDRLSAVDQQVLDLVKNGADAAELAATLNVNPAAARQQLCRARLRARTEIERILTDRLFRRRCRGG